LSESANHNGEIHRHDHASQRKSAVQELDMATQKCDFDVNLINEVRSRPILWDIRLDEYKESDKKPAVWLEIADKLGSSVGK
jgi:hypothetical protein